jgi:hypothetical protein
MRGTRRPLARAALAGALVTALSAALVFTAAPVAAVDGWAGPTRVVAALSPISPSLVLDADGSAHVAFVEGSSEAGPSGVFYATNEGGAWHKERVTTEDSITLSYTRPSLGLDAAGNAFIAFARVTCPDPTCETGTSRIYVATDKSGDWVVTPRTAGPADLAPSLVVRDGKLHIAFQRRDFPGFLGSPDSGIWYATNVSGAWAETQVASAKGKCYIDQLPSMALDPAGRVFIAYEAPPSTAQGCGSPSQGIRLVTNETGSWKRSKVSTDREDFGPSLAIDPSGRPGVTFDRGGTGVQFTRRNATGWSALSQVSTGGEASLAFGPDGRPRVAYEKNGVWYATKSGSTWTRSHLYTGPVDFQTYGGPRIAINAATKKARIVFARSESDDTPSEDDYGLYQLRQL